MKFEYYYYNGFQFKGNAFEGAVGILVKVTLHTKEGSWRLIIPLSNLLDMNAPKPLLMLFFPNYFRF